MTANELYLAVREGHRAHRLGNPPPPESCIEPHACAVRAGWHDAQRGYSEPRPPRTAIVKQPIRSPLRQKWVKQ